MALRANARVGLAANLRVTHEDVALMLAEGTNASPTPHHASRTVRVGRLPASAKDVLVGGHVSDRALEWLCIP